MALEIYVPGVGQHENIGDIILRRQLLRRLREVGELRIYVGASSDDYDEALGLDPSDRLYRSFASWYRKALASAAAGRASYVFKPGEIQLTVAGMKEHVSMLPVASLARLRGRPVVRIGAGSRNFAPIPRAIMGPSISVAHIVAWRDTQTAEYLRGPVMPDLAFGEGSDVADLAGVDARPLLAVSLRSDREATPDSWIDGVRRIAERYDLTPVAVSQVLRDNPKTIELAERLGCDAVTWSGHNHLGQEKSLRDIYARSLFAVSDRLHVLIAAFTEGALPLALLTDGSGKVARHFSAAGIVGIDLNLDASTPSDTAVELAVSTFGRRDELLDGLGQARSEIDAVFDRMSSLYETRAT